MKFTQSALTTMILTAITMGGSRASAESTAPSSSPTTFSSVAPSFSPTIDSTLEDEPSIEPTVGPSPLEDDVKADSPSPTPTSKSTSEDSKTSSDLESALDASEEDTSKDQLELSKDQNSNLRGNQIICAFGDADCFPTGKKIENWYFKGSYIGDYSCGNGSHVSLSERSSDSSLFFEVGQSTLIQSGYCLFDMALDVSECRSNQPIQIWLTGRGDTNRKWQIWFDGPNYGGGRIYSEACPGMVIGVDHNKRLVLQYPNQHRPAQEWIMG